MNYYLPESTKIDEKFDCSIARLRYLIQSDVQFTELLVLCWLNFLKAFI